MGIASDLRQSVLQAAMQGKLTTQKAEDGDARDLLLAIREEKEKLVKEKKIKKEKPLAPITDEEIPFDIPDNWVWCRLGEIITLVSGQDFSPHQYSDTVQEGFPYITGASNFGNHSIIENRWTKTPRCIVSTGDLLLVCKGSGYGRVMICNLTSAHIARQIMGIRQNNNVDVQFILLFLESNFDILKRFGQGVIPGISRGDVLNMQFPLPPLPEQRRIVARVEALMKEIDELEQTEKELEAIKAAFPGDMKASLLQAAMEGKLTTQKAEDGDAKDLLLAICEEKEKLVKEKKGKKEKPLAPIGEDEIPFDIPDNWVWCRLGDLGKSYGTDSFADGPFGSNLKKEHQITNPEVRIIQLSNIGENGWRDENRRYTSFEHLKTIARCEVQPGDFVIAKMMPAGRTIEVPNLGTKICLGSDAVKFSPHHMLDKKYLLIAMHSDAFLGQVYEEAHGITRVRTSLNKLKGYIIPLPPLAEQHRIVEKLDQLLPLCDSLSEH